MFGNYVVRWKLLRTRLFVDFPNLRSLRLVQYHTKGYMSCWTEIAPLLSVSKADYEASRQQEWKEPERLNSIDESLMGHKSKDIFSEYRE